MCGWSCWWIVLFVVVVRTSEFAHHLSFPFLLFSHQHRRGQRSGDGIIDMLHRAHHGGKEDHIHVDLEHPVQEELDPLLTAYVHLVDINSDPTQMIDAPGNSYAGVTADFCRLKWGLHKEDPSSGKSVFVRSAGCVAVLLEASL